MLKFDSHTLIDWKTRGISDISVSLVKRGCAGTKIAVAEGKHGDMDTSISQESLTLHMKSSEQDILSEGRITRVGTKWIYTSSAVNTRCSCGSSFSLKSGHPLEDKIARMKLAMKQKKEGIHR